MIDDAVFTRHLRFWDSLSRDLGMIASEGVVGPPPVVFDDLVAVGAFVDGLIAGTIRPQRPPPPPFTMTESRGVRARVAFFVQTIRQLAADDRDVDQLLAA